jgi:hypothetical protein
MAGLINLEKLGLGDNQIQDVTALANLTRLEKLGLGNNQIQDENPLKTLTRLVELVRDDTKIQDTQLQPQPRPQDLRKHQAILQKYGIAPTATEVDLGGELKHTLCQYGQPISLTVQSIHERKTITH